MNEHSASEASAADPFDGDAISRADREIPGEPCDHPFGATPALVPEATSTAAQLPRVCPRWTTERGAGSMLPGRPRLGRELRLLRRRVHGQRRHHLAGRRHERADNRQHERLHAALTIRERGSQSAHETTVASVWMTIRCGRTSMQSNAVPTSHGRRSKMTA